MPELPEAETIVRGLEGRVPGRRITAVEVLYDDVIEGPARDFADFVSDRRIDRIDRRGKNIVLVLDDRGRVVVNLGMSGRLLIRTPGDDGPPPTHPALRFRLAPEGAGDASPVLVYHDIRRFGRLRAMEPTAYRTWSRSLGPEPLGRRFTAQALEEALSHSISPVRSWLLDQRKLAGVGNIYANEALHVARVHPATPASDISEGRAGRLHRAIRRVLREAVRRRGTTLRDYRAADGSEGSYGASLRVYGREDEPCPRCRTPVERIVFGNRSAFLCPRCQPRP